MKVPVLIFLLLALFVHAESGKEEFLLEEEKLSQIETPSDRWLRYGLTGTFLVSLILLQRALRKRY